MRISDWSSDVCSSDLLPLGRKAVVAIARQWGWFHRFCVTFVLGQKVRIEGEMPDGPFFYVLKHESMFETIDLVCLFPSPAIVAKVELTRIPLWGRLRSEEHTSELQSLMRISYAVFCLKKKKHTR